MTDENSDGRPLNPLAGDQAAESGQKPKEDLFEASHNDPPSPTVERGRRHFSLPEDDDSLLARQENSYNPLPAPGGNDQDGLRDSSKGEADPRRTKPAMRTARSPSRESYSIAASPLRKRNRETIVASPSNTPQKRRQGSVPADLSATDGWLTGATISRLLHLIAAGQPASTYVADTSLVVRPRSPSLTHLSSPELTTLLLPIHHSNHWVLATVSKAQQSVLIFDSLPSAANTKTQTRIIDGFLRNVGTALSALPAPVPDSWLRRFASANTILAACPKQTNGYDCGIALLASAIHVVTGSYLPAETSYALWRDVFRALLLADPESESSNLFTQHISFSVSIHQNEKEVRDARHEAIKRTRTNLRYMCGVLCTLRSQVDVQNPTTEVGKAQGILKQRQEAVKTMRAVTRPGEMGAVQSALESEDLRLTSVVGTAVDVAQRLDGVITVMKRKIGELGPADGG
jgi:hypothetical protein